MKLTCCFTGHRPQSLPWGFAERGELFQNFQARLRQAVLDLIGEGYVYFITGMAQGVDTLCAEIVLELKKSHPNIMLECALPFGAQAERWGELAKARHARILSQADKVTVCTTGGYAPYVNSIRNKYMVDSSDAVIAGFNGGSGGTRNTIEYALEWGKRVIIVEPKPV